MEAAISCKFHCKRLAEHWQGYWPASDAAELAADIELRLAAATAGWGPEGHRTARRRRCWAAALRRMVAALR
jgi:hypothetical protein